jgi:hypothetical protein
MSDLSPKTIDVLRSQRDTILADGTAYVARKLKDLEIALKAMRVISDRHSHNMFDEAIRGIQDARLTLENSTHRHEQN